MTEEAGGLPDIIQALLIAHGKSLNLQQLQGLMEPERLSAGQLQEALEQLGRQLENGPLQLEKVASGYRLQIHGRYNTYIERLWEERPQRYSRAMLETLALVAYRQPVTRGEIEDVRGVSVSSHIIRTLQERDWIKVVGHKEVPGRPALFATTRTFLDYFNLQSLQDLPPLKEVRDLSAAFEQLQDSLLEQQQTAGKSLEIPEEEQVAVQELSFSHLLAELERMESNLKSDFEDLLPEQEEQQEEQQETGSS